MTTPIIAAIVTLAWNASTGPDVQGYRLKWGFEQGGPYPHTVETGFSLTTTVDEPWPLATLVYFTVHAYNAYGESMPSNEVSYIVPTPEIIPLPTPGPLPTVEPTPVITPAPMPLPSPTPAWWWWWRNWNWRNN